MKIQDILKETGKERGITIHEDGNFLLGAIDGFPVCISTGQYGSVNAVYITVRTDHGDFRALKKAIRGKKGMKGSMLKNPAGSRSIQYIIPYWFTVRTVRKNLSTALDGLMPAVGAHFRAPAAACEVCNKPGVENLVVESGLPMRICPGCAETIRVKREAARAAYEAMSPDYIKGTIFGLVGAAAGALGWAIMVLLTEKIYFIVAALIGVLVAFFVKKGMGRVDKAGYVIAGVLVLGSVVAGQVMTLVWMIYRGTGAVNVGMAFQGYMNILTNNPRELVIVAIFALLGVWIGVASLKKMEVDTKIKEIT